MKMGSYKTAGLRGAVWVLMGLGLVQGLAYGDAVRLRINEVGASNDQTIPDPQSEYIA